MREEQQLMTVGSALDVAFGLFVERFEVDGQDEVFRLGLGPIDLFNTEAVAPRVQVELDFASAAGSVRGEVFDLDASESVSLWMMKNVSGPGRNAAPEAGDTFLFIGDFTANGSGQLLLNEDIGSNLEFDFDALILTRAGQTPAQSVLAAGYRGIFEKRYFREKFGIATPSIPGLGGTNASSLDPLVQVGSDAFFNETFDGNGRTCGTCHRAENNMTIDPAFIATLPNSDPLFVAENVPELADLEDTDFLRGKGLIKENIDGFDDLDNKFTLRSVQHTFGLADSVARDTDLQPGFPPDEMTGWSGDGAPGRGTLLEFTFGAVMQHFPQTLDRAVGADFRIPTQLELDALEAFQLFSGRQTQPDVTPIVFSNAMVQEGKQLFNTQGLCFVCHNDAGSNIGNFENIGLDTGVSDRPEVGQLGLPKDGGLGREERSDGSFGDGTFNIQPLIEAADTAPFFHNNTASTLEDAISHYVSPAFRNSQAVQDTPALLDLTLNSSEISKVAAFLRAINVAENIRQVRKRVEFVRDNRGTGNDEILRIAIADCQDGMQILDQQSLYPNVKNALGTIKQTLEIALANPDSDRPGFMDHGLAWLGVAKQGLFSQNPQDEF